MYSYFLEYYALDYEEDKSNAKKALYEIFLEKSIDECLNDLNFSDKEYYRLVDSKLHQVRKDQERKKKEINGFFRTFINENNKLMGNIVEILNY